MHSAAVLRSGGPGSLIPWDTLGYQGRNFTGEGPSVSDIENFTHHPTVKTSPNYTYERLWTYFNSASRPHLEWVQSRVESAFGIRGRIEQLPRVGRRHDFFRLKYGNRASAKLLPLMYPSANVPMLERKWRIWDDYAKRRGIA